MRVSQQFSSSSSRWEWVRNWFPDLTPELSRSALMERSLYRTIRSSPCARSQQSWRHCHGVKTRSTLGGNIPAQWTSKGSSGWLLSPCLMFHTESKAVLNIHEGSSKHRKHQSSVYQSPVKQWNSYNRRAQIFILWHFSAKEVIYLMPWYSLLHSLSHCYHSTWMCSSERIQYENCSNFYAYGCLGYF